MKEEKKTGEIEEEGVKNTVGGEPNRRRWGVRLQQEETQRKTGTRIERGRERLPAKDSKMLRRTVE